jgi:hypothetical protein
MELRPLGTLALTFASDRLFMLGATPIGTRIIQEIGSAELVGDRLKATMKGAAAADWCTLTDGGLARFDIRLLLETADGALIYLPYTGKADWSSGPAQGTIFAVAQPETADERYSWLNAIQVVGEGHIAEDGTGVTYQLFELG